MLSDSAFGPDVHYAGFTLVLDPSDVAAEGQRWFDALAVGGRIGDGLAGKPSGPTASAKSSTALASPWMINVVKQG